MLRIVNSLSSRLDSYKRYLLEKLRTALERTRVKAQDGGKQIVGWFKGAKTRLKIALLTGWYKYRRQALWVSCAAVCLAAAIFLFRHWSGLDTYLSNLEKPVISELVIGIGAAITGIIAIAFSLSLFAIQQVADRGTPATVQAYARDRVLAAIYWLLVALAMTSFAAALLKTATTYRTVTVVAGLMSLFLSFILLNLHFRRVVRFADPRYTVSRFYKEGEKQLKRLQMLRASIVAKGHTRTGK